MTLGPGVPPDAPGKLGGHATPGALSPQIDLPARRRGHAGVGGQPRRAVGRHGRRWAICSTSSSSPAAPPSRAIVANDAGFTWDYAPSADRLGAADGVGGRGSRSPSPSITGTRPAGCEGSNPVKRRTSPPPTCAAPSTTGICRKARCSASTTAGATWPFPIRRANPTDATNHCVACHTISRDGRYLAGELWGGGLSGAVFDLTNPTSSWATRRRRWRRSTRTPRCSRRSTPTPRASSSTTARRSRSSIRKTGMTLPTTGTPLPTAKAAHPTWSPDGTLIAFVNNTDGTWAVDYTTGDLAIIAVSGRRHLRRADDDRGERRRAIRRSRRRRGRASRPTRSGSPTAPAPTRAVATPSACRPSRPSIRARCSSSGARAARRCASTTPARASSSATCPASAPYDSGGYFWLVFYSVRDYGNAQAGTKGTQRRQMWVTAIDKSKLGTRRRSVEHRPTGCPMQDPKTENMSAFWAPPPPLQ